MRLFSALLFASALSAVACFGQYTAAPSGGAPSELAGPVRDAMQKTGTKIAGNGTTIEVWFRATAPKGTGSSEPDVTLTAIPQGALVGAIRITGKYTDRRGTTIQPGVYTLRYSDYPVNGEHQGVAPQRDFLLMVPAANDGDPASTPGFDALVAMSKKASGTPHPAVLSCYKSDSGDKPGLAKAGDTDWVLTGKMGDTMISVTVVGTVST